MVEKVLNRIPMVILPLTCLVMLTGMLYVGLRPFQFSPANSVEWLKDPDGIRFHSYGIAYSQDKLALGDNGITIELSAEALRESNHTVTILAELYGGMKDRWLVIGQWRSSLIVRWRDGPETGRKGFYEIGVKDALPTGVRQQFVIASGKGGVSVYVNGVLMAADEHQLPFGSYRDKKAYLILGNFSGGHDQWYGSIYRLAFYRGQVGDGEETSPSHEYWFRGAKRDNDYIVRNARGGEGEILVPARFNVPHKIVLRLPWDEFKHNHSYFKDAVINLVGFMPFGFAVALFFRVYFRSSLLTAFFLPAAAGVALSLTIEIIQVYMPSRTSSSTDFMLNTLGTLIGVLLLSICWKGIRENISSPLP